MRTLIASLLFVFLVPAAIHAQWSPEFPVSPPVLGAPPGPQSFPAVASDGSGFLVVWAQGNIFAARVSATGELMDRTPINVSGITGGLYEQPHVAWNGDSYLVVWRAHFYSVYGRLLSRDGRPIGPVRNVNDHGSGLGGPYLGSNGDSFLVASGGIPFQMAMVSRDGTARVFNATGLAGFDATSVASDGRDYLIAGTRPPNDEAAVIKVSARGEIVANYAVGRSSWPPHLVWTGNGYLLLARGTLLGVTRLDANGAPIADLIPIGPDRLGNYVTMGSLGDGTAMVVSEDRDADYSPRNLTLSRITSSGVESRQDLGVRGAYPTIAAGSGSALLVWSGSDALRHAILDPGPRLIPPPGALSSLSAAEQRHPFAAATRIGWFLVWEETGGDDRHRVRGTIVTSSFRRGETFGIADSTLDQKAPIAVTNGRTVLVVWYETPPGGTLATLRARRFSLTGEPLDGEPSLLVSRAGSSYEFTYQPRASATWNGRYFLVAWTGRDDHVRLARVTEEGLVLDPEGKRAPESARRTVQVYPAIASVGEVSLLLWQDGSPPLGSISVGPAPPPPPRIEGVRLDVEGASVDPIPILVKPETVINVPTAPRLTSDGSRFFVIWPAFELVEGVSVAKDGSVSAPFEVSPRNQEGIDLAIDAAPGGFFATWVSERGLLGRFLAPGRSPEVVKLAEGERLALPIVRSRSNGQLMVLYERWSNEDGGVVRSYFRVAGPAATRRRPVRSR